MAAKEKAGVIFPILLVLSILALWVFGGVVGYLWFGT